jgi:hypothetical protein
VRRDLKGAEANVQAEAKANRRWPSTSTTRHKNGEVSYRTYGPRVLRGSVQKELGGVGMVITVSMNGKCGI